jgi:glycosidase
LRSPIPWLACLALVFTSCRLQPDAPTHVVAVAGVRQATVRWTASPPISELLPIAYTVTASPGGATATSTTAEATVLGLANGTTYTFTVVASHRLDQSLPSAPSAPVTTPELPGAPTGVVAEAGAGQAKVRWTPPAADGGRPIMRYTVTAVPGGRTATAAGTAATVAGLTDGGTYAFTVAATSAVGTGPASAPSAAVVPAPAVAFDTAEVPVGDTASALDPTWKWGPFMHVFVRAYRDSDGDGEGDLAGLVEKLDYLHDLGIRGILLLPIFANQDRDHGYLTTNFRGVAPDYGTLADLDRLLAEAHRRGMGVLLDGVLQYSGSAHPGFVSASASAASPWRDWYLWSPGDPGWGPYGWETATGWYYGLYGRTNPVLNWKNPAVLAYHQNTLRYWLNRGVDGFRIDAVETLVPNGPDALFDQPENLEAAAALRRVVDAYPNRLLLCEAPYRSAAFASSTVCGGGFLFSLAGEAREDGTWATLQSAVLVASQRSGAEWAIYSLANDPMNAPIGAMGTFLGNHDRFAGKRLWDQLGGDTAAYRLAAATLLLMPGAPFLYYGEEVGMAETLLPTANPDSDHHQRGVMSWTGDAATAGFSARPALSGPAAIEDPDDKYLAPVPNAADHNVAAEQGDPGSLLGWYRQLIALRGAHDALARGLYRPLVIGEDVGQGGAWAFERSHGDEEIVVALNYGAEERTLWLQLAPGLYEVLTALGAPPAPLLVEGGGAEVTLPPRSLIVYRLGREAPPLGDLYVRGSFNGWDATGDTALAYQGGNLYQGSVVLPAGPMQLKLAGWYWEVRINAGILGGGEVHLGESQVLEQTGWLQGGSGAELRLDVPADGGYRFTVDADDPYRPVLTVEPDPTRPVPARWQRPATPAAPSATGMSWVEDPAAELTWIFADGELLALFNNHGNTFIEFWVGGVNVIGGYDPAPGWTNWGPAQKGHSPGYPFGQFVGGEYWPWEGFYAGFNIMDPRWKGFLGVTGGPHAFDVQVAADGRLDLHTFDQIARDGLPLYDLDVHYYVSRQGIGVRDDVQIRSDLSTWGGGDTGGQFLMTQADSDLDPALPYDRELQPDQYFQLGVDGAIVDLDPFPPYGRYSPSNEYTDMDYRPDGDEFHMQALPGGALVAEGQGMSYVTAMGRRSRATNLALRVDQLRSTLPPMEHYCEINGERDYLNFNFNAALGWNGPSMVPGGVAWRLYGDLLPWSGTDPEVLRGIPMLSDGIP